jgi:hypothetical protein
LAQGMVHEIVERAVLRTGNCRKHADENKDLPTKRR